MSETAPTDPTATGEPNDEGATPEPAEELGEGGRKALNAEREAREAAEKLSKDLAKKLKAIEDRDKSEAEKQREALETAQAELEALTTAKTRAEVAADKAVPTALLAGPASNSPEDIAKFAEALIEFRGEQGSNRLHVSGEGKSPSKQVNSELQAARELFGRSD